MPQSYVNENGLTKQDYKTILHSKRANMYYLEKCRVMQKDGNVVFLTQNDETKQYFNIPIANTTVILLGNGTSITQGAMRLLCGAGVLVGFSGGGGTPLLAGTEISFLNPESEYRPTEYMQGWVRMWYTESCRLACAKHFQKARCQFLKDVWQKDEDLKNLGFNSSVIDIESALMVFDKKIDLATNTTMLLLAEAEFTKSLYKFSSIRMGHENFVRDREADDLADIFLNHGNYLAYGLAATALWVLGIPHGFAVMHGKTRRGALVFDVADLIKDAVVLPNAFIAERKNFTEKEFRMYCLQKFAEHKVLDYMFKQVEDCARLYGTGEVK